MVGYRAGDLLRDGLIEPGPLTVGVALQENPLAIVGQGEVEGPEDESEGVEVGAHALDHGGRRLNDRPTEVHPQRGTRLRLYPPPHPRTLPRRELESCFVAITDED